MEIKVEGLNVHYKIKGKGFPIVMIHGYSLDHRSMSGCMEPILESSATFQRIYFDLPGMGQTPSRNDISNSGKMLEITMAFINKIIPNQNFALAGLSYGGYLARGVANLMNDLVHGMLLICPVSAFARAKRRGVPRLKVLEKDDNLIESLSMVDAEDFQSCVVRQTRDVWERFRDEISPGLRLADFGLLERVRDTEFSFDPDKNAKEFNKPVSILLSRFDNSVGYLDGIELFKKYPNAALLIADKAGHLLHMEQEDLFNATVKDWLERLEAELAVKHL